MSAQILTAPSVAELLRTVWPRHAAKHAATAARGSVATARAWVRGSKTPSADTLLLMAAANEQLRAELLRRLGGYGYAASPDAAGLATAQDRSRLGEIG